MRIISKETEIDKDILVIGVLPGEIPDTPTFYRVNDGVGTPVTVVADRITITINSLKKGDKLEIYTNTNSKDVVLLSYTEQANSTYHVPIISEGVIYTEAHFSPMSTTVTLKAIDNTVVYKEINIDMSFLDNFNRGFNEGYILGQLL